MKSPKCWTSPLANKQETVPSSCWEILDVSGWEKHPSKKGEKKKRDEHQKAKAKHLQGTCSCVPTSLQRKPRKARLCLPCHGHGHAFSACNSHFAKLMTTPPVLSNVIGIIVDSIFFLIDHRPNPRLPTRQHQNDMACPTLLLLLFLFFSYYLFGDWQIVEVKLLASLHRVMQITNFRRPKMLSRDRCDSAYELLEMQGIIMNFMFFFR